MHTLTAGLSLVSDYLHKLTIGVLQDVDLIVELAFCFYYVICFFACCHTLYQRLMPIHNTPNFVLYPAHMFYLVRSIRCARPAYAIASTAGLGLGLNSLSLFSCNCCYLGGSWSLLVQIVSDD